MFHLCMILLSQSNLHLIIIINAIKRLRGLASSATTTFLSLENDTVLDTIGNTLSSVESEPINPSAYTSDITASALLSFDLVMRDKTESLDIVF